MPKREATPPPGDDEPNYFTVVNPFPRGANMELRGDVNQFVQWLAAAMGGIDHLLALFHKPSSRGNVIIEVSKYYEDPRRLLGRHSWNGNNGVLLKPEVGHSDIFYCFYTTGRSVEKHGWKRKDIEEEWFADQGTRNKVFRNPYPRTTFVPVPLGDPTTLELCRNLPLALFEGEEMPKPIQPASAPVGSSAWNALRAQQPVGGTHGKPLIDPLPVPDESVQTEGDMSTNLWAESEDKPPIPITSDFYQMSIGDSKEKGNCPFHGTTCSKGICTWRAEDEKKRGPKVGGPSNIKNYRNARGGGKGRGRGQSRITSPPSKEMASVGLPVSPTSPASPTSPVSPPPRTGAATANTVKTVTRAPPPPVGLARGTPVWASRGRGRGQAS